MKALLLPFALLCACGDGTPVELSTSAATPSTDGETAEEVKLAPIGRGYWNASLVSPDGAPAGVVSEDGKRTMSWEVRVGEGIEFLTFGFIGSGQARVISRSNVNGEKSLLLSVELDEFSAEDVVGELRYLGAPKETVDQLRLDLGEARALRSKTTVTGRFVATSATGYVPGHSVMRACGQPVNGKPRPRSDPSVSPYSSPPKYGTTPRGRPGTAVGMHTSAPASVSRFPSRSTESRRPSPSSRLRRGASISWPSSYLALASSSIRSQRAYRSGERVRSSSRKGSPAFRQSP